MSEEGGKTASFADDLKTVVLGYTIVLGPAIFIAVIFFIIWIVRSA
jgi:hypothetical protein